MPYREPAERPTETTCIVCKVAEAPDKDPQVIALAVLLTVCANGAQHEMRALCNQHFEDGFRALCADPEDLL